MPQSLVSRTVLDELGAVIGRETLGRLVDRFVATLTAALADDGRAGDGYAREAHTLISMAGMLGCDALSQACRDIEHAVRSDADLAGPLAEARSLRDGTVASLRALRPATGDAP